MNLRIPGPTPCPDYVLEAMTKQMINHRGPEFRDMIFRVTENLKKVFRTDNDLLILTGSGTGGMEAAIVNVLSPGDKVLSVSIGIFGDRFAQIAETYGASVIRLPFTWGTAADAKSIEIALKENQDIKAVLITHNETSTAVTNDLASISKIVKDHGKLLIVDAISSLSSLPFYTDEWGCDVVISGSQKGYMVPPGLAFVSVSQEAWGAFNKATMPRFYWDFGRAKTYFERGQNPWTPAVSIIYGLDVALEAMLDQGLDSIYQHHARMGSVAREGVKRLGLQLFSDEGCASNTVTAITMPDGIDGRDLSREVENDHGVVLAGGQGSLEGKIVRIGHLGYVSEQEVVESVDAIGQVLPKIEAKI